MEPLVGQRQKGESLRAVQACNDYMRLGPGRSLSSLLALYAKSDQLIPPTQSMGALKRWSAKYTWQERAGSYDAQTEESKNIIATERMKTGLALPHERVQKLKDLAAFLEVQMFEQGEEGKYHNVWLPDVKQIGGGEYAERVDIERFNSAIIEQYRGVLDDLAKETGGRVSKTDVTTDGKAFDLTPFGKALEKIYGDGDQ